MGLKWLKKLWRVPRRKGSSYFCTRKLGEAKMSTCGGRASLPDPDGWCWCLPRAAFSCNASHQGRELWKLTGQWVWVHLASLKYQHVLRLIQCVWCFLWTLSQLSKISIFCATWAKCGCSVQIAYLPWDHLSPLELRQTLSIQCDLRKPGVTNKDKFDLLFFFFKL